MDRNKIALAMRVRLSGGQHSSTTHTAHACPLKVEASDSALRGITIRWTWLDIRQ